MKRVPRVLAGLVRASLLASTVVRQASPFHLSDAFIAEDSRLRLLMLKVYARFEVQLLALFFRLLHLPLVKYNWVRVLYYHPTAKFLTQRAVACQVLTLSEMETFIKELPEDSRIAVGPCRCRLAAHVCDHPMETDMYILTGTPIWLKVFPKDYRVIGKDEATEIVRKSYEVGLVLMVDRHMYYKGSANYFVICNCCGCACLPIIGYRTFKRQGFHFIPSIFRSVVDPDLCRGCGTCVEVCNFNERVVTAGKAHVFDCQGCGLCVKFCPNNANSMVEREAVAG